MVRFILDSGKTGSDKVRAFKSGKTGLSMRDTGRITRLMVRVV